MRIIKSSDIISSVKQLCADAQYNLPDDVLSKVKSCIKKDSSAESVILNEIVANAKTAKETNIALCQDTGVANFFVTIGRNVSIEDGDIFTAVNKGTELGYKDNFLRKSIVSDPIERKNTQTNTPANIYCDYNDGDKIEITFLPKGGGSDNASALKMLTPSEGWEGIKIFVKETIKEKGPNACPPLVIGVGIGGDFSSVGLIAKKTLLRNIDSENTDIRYRDKEKELLAEINSLGIGPMGLGGQNTALAVFIEARPCHIASLPAAVIVQCHSYRRKTVIL